MARLGIELLSVFGMPPVAHVKLAAELGCSHISTGLTPMPFNPQGYRSWSLRDDAEMRRDLKAVMRECGVVIGSGEGFTVRPGQDLRDKQGDFDLMAELGAERVGGVSMEPDLERTKDQFALLAEYAQQRGMGATMEFAPPHPVGNLTAALAVINHVNKPNFQLVIDAMHFFRSGGSVAELATLDASNIGYAQLCDVPLQPLQQDYLQEAMFNRLVPGEGELPLAEFVRALPRDVPIGLEIPMRAQAELGISPYDRLLPAVVTAKALLRSAGDGR
jgi:sugar phosphate isomerase/epimerase